MSRVMNRFASLLPHVCLLLAVLVPVSVIAIIAIVPAANLAMSLDLSEHARAQLQLQLGWERRFIATLICLLPAGSLAYALMNARSALRRFNSGEYFSASAIRGIRGFGAGIFWSGLLTLVAAPPAMYVLTYVSDGTHSSHPLNIRVDMSTLVMLAIGGILWQIASMMQRAAEIAEENRQFV